MSHGIAWHNRLTVRVVLFLTLALVPLGVIGVMQNQRLSAEIERRSELSLMALTERAASGETQLIQRAFGAVDTLTGLPDTILGDPSACRDAMRRFLQANERFAFAGYMRLDGVVECSTADAVLNYADDPSFPDLIANQRTDIRVNLNGEGSQKPVIVISEPHFSNGALKGYVSISLPLRDVGAAEDFAGEANPIILVTFNAKGQLLSSEQERQEARNSLPRDIALANLAYGSARTFVATSATGQELAYSVVPIVPDLIYALGSWQAAQLDPAGPWATFEDAALPFLMWLASLLVVWFVMDRLVLERIAQLNGMMRNFSQARTLPARSPENPGAASELGELETAFYNLAQDVLRDEAEQENRLREKSVLLKEVHHRVKNNLQIISSIMNMQIRKAHADETKHALGQVQERIMALSGVHQTLYQAERLTEVDAGMLVRKIVEQSRAIGGDGSDNLTFKLDLQPIIIFPDQAVPLSMLVSEALTNAMKYIGGPHPTLAVTLALDDAAVALLEIKNSRGRDDRPDGENADPISTGLGQQLIRAFTTQLGGTFEIAEDEDSYFLKVQFQVESFKEEPQDY